MYFDISKTDQLALLVVDKLFIFIYISSFSLVSFTVLSCGGRLGGDHGFHGFCDAVYTQTRSSYTVSVLIDICCEVVKFGEKYTKWHKQS